MYFSLEVDILDNFRAVSTVVTSHWCFLGIETQETHHSAFLQRFTRSGGSYHAEVLDAFVCSLPLVDLHIAELTGVQTEEGKAVGVALGKGLLTEP